jgi:hypothetical protein
VKGDAGLCDRFRRVRVRFEGNLSELISNSDWCQTSKT